MVKSKTSFKQHGGVAMARKDLLKGLMDDGNTPADPPARVDTAKPRYQTGAIGAVSRSIDDLKRRAVIDVDPRQIDAAGLRDRLDASDPDFESLKRSIESYGQQVPVMLRVNPNDPERYQVVYGRRRVAALLDLGQPVKALIRDLDDKALIMAQGQENSARRDLSFIERANFARQMRDAGYDRKVICDALSMDKTLISRMLTVADKIPVTLIEAIGAAPGIGRDRWLALAGKIGRKDLTEHAKGDTSDARFDAVMAALKTPKPPTRPPAPVTATDGTALGQVSTKGKRTVLTLEDPEFAQWVTDHLPAMHRDWTNQSDA